MSGGVLFDLYALGFGAIVAALIGIVCVLTARRPKIHDWESEWPEFGLPKPGHIRVISTAGFYDPIAGLPGSEILVDVAGQKLKVQAVTETELKFIDYFRPFPSMP